MRSWKLLFLRVLNSIGYDSRPSNWKLYAQKKYNHPKSKKIAEKFPKLGVLTV
jgi:hypothetical protein